MSYYQDEREYFYANQPRHSSARRNSFDSPYHEEKRQARRLPDPDSVYGGYGERRRKSILKLENAPRSHERVAFQPPLSSPASTLSRKSSRSSFSDSDELHGYYPHQRALTYPHNNAKDNDYFDMVAEKEKRRKMKNKTFLYAGLACVTTVAASNNIYQSTKAHMGRRHEMQQGTMDMDEATKMRKKGFMMDLISAGVGAVCINNTFKGWNKYEALKKEEKKADALLKKKRRERREEDEYFASLR